MSIKMLQLQVVVPVFNEEAVLQKFHQVIMDVISKINMNSEILYVNDGSSDASLSILKSFQVQHDQVSVLDLSRNYGQVTAIRAGLDYSDADVVVVIDADLQYPPELIPEMINRWKEGSEIVSPVYQTMAEGLNHTLLRNFFYKIFSKINPRIPQNAPQSFYLLDKKVVKAICTCRESNPFMRELLSFVGFRETTILFTKHDRFAGYGKWTLLKQINYALSGIILSTTLPLKIPTYLSLMILLFALLMLIFKMKTIFIAIIILLGVLNLGFLGLMGEYVSRIFDQARNRPFYFVREFYAKKRSLSKTKAPLKV